MTLTFDSKAILAIDDKKKSLCQKHTIGVCVSNCNSEYDQEIPQSHTADNPVAPRGRAAQPSQDTRKTN